MKHPLAYLMALTLSQLLSSPAGAQIEDALQDIVRLSHLNGQALACQETRAAARAKELMLRHAPKTARFGAAFDDGTNEAYLAQIRTNPPCPDEATLMLQLAAQALKLQLSLPVSTVPTPATTP